MKIEEIKEQGRLTLKLSGRLDTSTVSQLEAALGDNLTDVSELILDFAELDYISSAGLRILLAAHKTMKKKEGIMVVKDINEEIEEVFIITGFMDILNVKKKEASAENAGGL